MKKNLPLLSVFSFLILFSCSGIDPFEIDSVDFGNPEIGLPLVNSTFYISDLGVNTDNKTDVLIDAEGKVTLRYTDAVEAIPISDWFPRVTDLVLSVQNNPQEIPMPFNDVDIRRGILKNTDINFEVQNPTNEVLNVVVELASIIDPSTGLSLRHSFEIAPNEKVTSANLNLDTKELITSNGSMEVSYLAATHNNPSVVISDFVINCVQLDFSYLEGIFENVKHSLAEDAIDVSFFDNWVSGGLELDPSAIFSINNSTGIPAQLKINYAELTTFDNQVVQIESDLLGAGIDCAYPSLSEVGQTMTTIIELNSSNSNFNELLDAKPTGIDYDIELTINPSQSDEIGFYSDQSQIGLDAIVELPMYLKANDLVLQDTFGFNEISFDQIDSTGELKLDLINSFPIGLSLNLYFLVQEGNRLFSLVEENNWVSAEANTEPNLTIDDIPSTLTSVPIAEENLDQLSSISKVLLKVKITTKDITNDDFVWIYDHHGISVKLGAVLK